MKNEKRINLMALMPSTDFEVQVCTVGMPAELRDILFTLMPPRYGYGRLPTGQLSQEVLCWVDHAIEMGPIEFGNDDILDWIIAIKPVDLERLCAVMVNWVRCSCREAMHDTRVYKDVMHMLVPSTFKRLVGCGEVMLFDKGRKPMNRLAFRGFSAFVTDSIVGRPVIMPNGEALTFGLATGSGRKGCELVSNVLYHEGDPWSVVLRLHVETLPRSRESRLNVSASVRRYIRSKRPDANVYMEKDVRAYVMSKSGVLRTVPYGYRKHLRGLAWDELARRNFEALSDVRLPEITDYLEDMERYSTEGALPRILSPCSTSIAWDRRNRVASGLSVDDKEALFNFVADALVDVTQRLKPLVPVTLTNLQLAHADAPSKLWNVNPIEAEKKHDEWRLSNRSRVVECIGQDRLALEIVGSEVDADVMKLVYREITDFLGDEGISAGLHLTLREVVAGDLLGYLEGTSGATLARARRIERQLGQADVPTACIVLLPGRDYFGDRDPKQAIRIGLAKSGRLSQFLVPVNEDGKLEHRAKAAVRDLMRQLGFLFELRTVRGGVDANTPVWGVTVLELRRGKKPWQLPLAVKIVPGAGSVEVDCPLFGGRRLSYREAQLELARIVASVAYCKPVDSITGLDLKRILDMIKREALDEKTLMLVHAYGHIRREEWWPGISDRRLAEGALKYGPTRLRGKVVDDEPYDCDGAALSILRLRNGGNGEVPDYYTDKKPVGEDGKERGHFNRQGLFAGRGYFLGLTARPSMKDYEDSFKSSKFDNPSSRFSEKTLNEYCLITVGEGRAAQECARYAEAMRGCVVQLVNSSTRINLPAPLHLAECLAEYMWC